MVYNMQMILKDDLNFNHDNRIFPFVDSYIIFKRFLFKNYMYMCVFLCRCMHVSADAHWVQKRA